MLEFLQLPELGPLKENALEQAITDELQKFLQELGKGFSFVETSGTVHGFRTFQNKAPGAGSACITLEAPDAAFIVAQGFPCSWQASA